MKGLWVGSLAAALMGSLFASGYSTALAQTAPKPLRIFENENRDSYRECGKMIRANGAWELTDCPSLFAIVADDQCGNAKLDPGEPCDQSGEVTGCTVTGTHCDNCERCVTGPTPTRTPTPTPTPVITSTPPPGNASCPDGFLPLMGIPGNTVFGIDWVPVVDGLTRTYCFELKTDTSSLFMMAADRGGGQCSHKTAKFYPPLGSTLPVGESDGWDASYTHRLRTGFLPKGVYRIQVTTELGPNCASWYWVAAYP